MTFAHGCHGEPRRYLRPSGLAPLAALVLVSAAFLPAGAGAAPTRQAAAAGSTFCTDAAKFGKGGVSNLQTQPPEVLQADYKAFKALHGSMIPVAPKAVRSNLQKVFTFDLGLFSELSKSQWSFAKIPPTILKQWSIAGPKLKPVSDEVIGYLNTTCHLKLIKP
jgi:hypothetical protein